MATFAPNKDIETRLDERVREAWTAYKECLTDLDGREYDEAEAGSWARLQDTLREIDGEREALAATAQDGA
jgi:hypothetical protein